MTPRESTGPIQPEPAASYQPGLGGNFRTDRFRFFSRFDRFSGAVESYLISGQKQVVEVERLRCSFFFEDGGTPYQHSRKYLEAEVVPLARETGSTVIRQMKNQRGYFLDSLWQAGTPERLPSCLKSLVERVCDSSEYLIAFWRWLPARSPSPLTASNMPVVCSTPPSVGRWSISSIKEQACSPAISRRLEIPARSPGRAPKTENMRV